MPRIGKYDDSEAVMERPQRANHQIALESLAPETHSGMCYIVQFVSGSAFVSGLKVPTHIRCDQRTSPVESRQSQTLERGTSRSETDVGHDDQFKNRDTEEFNPIFLDLAY